MKMEVYLNMEIQCKNSFDYLKQHSMYPVGKEITLATDIKREIGQYLVNKANINSDLTWKQHAGIFYNNYIKYAGRYENATFRKKICDQYMPQLLDDIAYYMSCKIYWLYAKHQHDPYYGKKFEIYFKNNGHIGRV